MPQNTIKRTDKWKEIKKSIFLGIFLVFGGCSQDCPVETMTSEVPVSAKWRPADGFIKTLDFSISQQIYWTPVLFPSINPTIHSYLISQKPVEFSVYQDNASKIYEIRIQPPFSEVFKYIYIQKTGSEYLPISHAKAQKELSKSRISMLGVVSRPLPQNHRNLFRKKSVVAEIDQAHVSAWLKKLLANSVSPPSQTQHFFVGLFNPSMDELTVFWLEENSFLTFPNVDFENSTLSWSVVRSVPADWMSTSAFGTRGKINGLFEMQNRVSNCVVDGFFVRIPVAKR
jgi:hypothetical protein